LHCTPSGASSTACGTCSERGRAKRHLKIEQPFAADLRRIADVHPSDVLEIAAHHALNIRARHIPQVLYEPFGCAEVPAIQLIARQEICLRPDGFVLEELLGDELLNQRAQELRVDREIFERPHFVAHNGNGLLGIIRGHIQPDRRESVIAEAR